MDALADAAARGDGPGAARRRLEQRPQRAATTPPSTRPTCSSSRSRACPSRTPRTRRAAPWPGCYAWVVPLQLRPGRALAAAARRGARPSSTRRPRGSEQQLAAFRAAIAHRRPTRRCCAAGSAATSRRASTSTSTCAGGCWSGSPRSARSTAPSCDAAARRRADRRSRGSRTRRRARVAARRRGQGLGVDVLHRRGRRAQLRARGGRPRHVARRPGASSTDAVRRALLRRPARHRRACAAAGCWPTPPSTSSRARR